MADGDNPTCDCSKYENRVCDICQNVSEASEVAQGGNTKANTKRELPEALRQNLWKPGQCGNPSGRPKKKPVTELYEQILSDPANLALVEKAIVKALSRGQMAMVLQLKEMTDRVEGKVTQPIEADVTVNLADAIAEARKRAGR